MVLTRRVGKERPFIRGFLLTVVTFGLYRYYWLYKAHSEVFKQYELDREGRDDGVVWLVLGIVLPLLILVYYWKFVDNVRYVRQRMRLPDGITPGKFVGLHIGGMLAIFVAIIVAIGVLAAFAPEAEGGEFVPGEDPEADAAMGTFFALYGLGILVYAGLVVVAYFGLQRDINETWGWYDSHMASFTGGPPPTSPPPYLPQSPQYPSPAARPPEPPREPEPASPHPAPRPTDQQDS